MVRRKPSMVDVAKRAGVSQTTVSYVLSGRQDVVIPQSTRERIWQAARELGYRPNGLARGLVRGKTQTIGVLIPRMDSSFHALIMDGIQEVCTATDYRVLLADSRHNAELETRQVEMLLEHRVDGIISIAVAGASSGTWVRMLKREGVPLVIVDEHTFEGEADCVVSDDVTGARKAVQHLIQLGHRRIVHLGAGSDMSAARDRQAGYLLALQSAGIEPRDEWVRGDSFFMPVERIHEIVAELLHLSEPPTALFAANDDLAAEAMQVAREHGVQVPQQLAIVGYGNTEVGRHLRLTTVHQDPRQMGQIAARRLMHRLQNMDLPVKCMKLPTQLVIRESCGSLLQAQT
ncbi:MAG: LacI family transcriptional regulator [Armatimonadota bacterium]|nr:MAG: LacI family transcriptional regulator [Armatimonadota bacterium]